MPTTSEKKTPGKKKPLSERIGKDQTMLIVYARVSTQDQNLELQTEALAKAGCKKVFADKTSGSRSERPGLARHRNRSAKVTRWSYGNSPGWAAASNISWTWSANFTNRVCSSRVLRIKSTPLRLRDASSTSWPVWRTSLSSEPVRASKSLASLVVRVDENGR